MKYKNNIVDFYPQNDTYSIDLTQPSINDLYSRRVNHRA